MPEVLLASALLMITVGCGGASQAVQSSPTQNSPSPEQELGTLTLSDTGCAYQGNLTFTAGTVAVHEVNNSKDTNLFASMGRLMAGHEYSEFATYIADEEKRIEAGNDPLGPPSYISDEFGDLVTQNTSSTTRKYLSTAGTYALVCGRVKGEKSLGIWVFGPITMAS